ncbi:unnamed protein product, partial [marine sediment metagenome]
MTLGSMHVNHRGFDIFMSHKISHTWQIDTIHYQLAAKCVPEGMN